MGMPKDLADTVELVPVKDWVWNLYKVVYTRDQDGRHEIATKWFVSTETHLEGDADRYCPKVECWYTWECIEEGVQAPRPIGTLYGQKMYSDGPVDPAEYGHGEDHVTL